MSGLCSTLSQVWMRSWRAMFQDILFLLMVIGTAVEVNGKQVKNTQRNQLPTAHMWEMTGNWMEHLENELKNNMQTLQKVLNQLLPMKDQVQETLLSIDEQKKNMQVQRDTLKTLHGHNSFLDPIILIVEAQQKVQLEGLHGLKEVLQQLLYHNNSTLTSIQDSLQAARSGFSFRHQNQRQLLETLRDLINLINWGRGAPLLRFQDCEDIRRSGLHEDNIYTILVPNVTEPKRVFCVMDTDGGAWTVIQRRADGTVNFQRNWQDYKQGFGDPTGEYWLGNEVVHQLTSSKNYFLRIEMEDWDNHTFYANFKNFHLGSEEQFYRIFLNQYSGFTSYENQLILKENPFSTHDADHDVCNCNCAQELSGGWWYNSCGASNLNGIYYPANQHLHKIDGIRWHYSFADPTYSLKSSRMMIRSLFS